MPTPIRGVVPPPISDAIRGTIPERLGWAVIQLWNDIPKDVRDRIREQAVFVEIGQPTVQLDQQVGSFLGEYAGKL